MKNLLRLAVVIFAAALIMVAIGAFWIWRTLYPQPLPSKPWEVPAIKMPTGPPPNIKPEKGK
jgi:hypothetical protein